MGVLVGVGVGLTLEATLIFIPPTPLTTLKFVAPSPVIFFKFIGIINYIHFFLC